ncbi:cytochrome-c peroxidase [Flavobacteriaceae bacterium XHP0103]|uniref:cytochrome-c peroxidase n=1 Tax=Marixanthotalea marina TaxID=2844359 RepID=UPI002989DAE1|nr:cytochrome c peroxidase [Marixanthotalea marina]MBU3822584.1 cytochrome-c peroxidase [Marixanthotalea marina]
MNLRFYNFIFIFSILITSCKDNKYKEISKEEQIENINWQDVKSYYEAALSKSISLLDTLVQQDNRENAKEIFEEVRANFKVAEGYASYLNPEVGHRANGPALPVFLDDSERVIAPIGLQKIEETVYEGDLDDNFEGEVYMLKGLLNNLLDNVQKKELTAQRFFISTHEQLLRIISFSITGFDTPVSQLGLKEAVVSLTSLKTAYETALKSIIVKKDSELNTSFLKHINTAISFINSNKDFETFDRYTFIRDYMNPITRDWVKIREISDIWKPVDNKVFNFDAPTFFENNSFNTDYFMPSTNRKATEAQIKLGERLFFEPKLSKAGNMACATCHVPDKAYADGLVVNNDNQGNGLKRNTPTLINSVYQKALFWDGRSTTLDDQIASVFANEVEFNTNVHEFSSEILQDSTYYDLFKEAYGSIPKRNREVVKAIASYIGKLNGFNSKFDKNMRAEEATFTEEEKQGLNLFMGKALCATCHFMPLTNGSVPPFYNETEKEVIGVPQTAANTDLDDDTGFYWRWKQPIHYGMFKTPTVRNVELTGPYMHNGVYETLEEVVDFYNKGGGAGLGFELEHQTLPFDNLNLTLQEQQALVSFMKTLTDVNVEIEY